MRRNKKPTTAIQSSIARNQKINNIIQSNAMKILNSALCERIRERDNQIHQLQTEINKLLTKIEKHKIQKTTP
jgi:hypothetical protein